MRKKKEDKKSQDCKSSEHIAMPRGNIKFTEEEGKKSAIQLHMKQDADEEGPLDCQLQQQCTPSCRQAGRGCVHLSLAQMITCFFHFNIIYKSTS